MVLSNYKYLPYSLKKIFNQILEIEKGISSRTPSFFGFSRDKVFVVDEIFRTLTLETGTPKLNSLYSLKSIEDHTEVDKDVV